MRSFLSRVWASPALPPFLFATFPIIFLWARNVRGGYAVRTVLSVLAIVLAVTAAVYVIFRVTTRSSKKAGLATTIMVILFLSFGHFAIWLGAAPRTLEETGLLLAWSLLAIAGVILAVSRGDRVSPTVFRTLSFIATVLIAVNLVTIVRYGSPSTDFPTAIWDVPVSSWSGGDADHRDVYYLIFDRYANESTLRDQYGFDNAPFLDALATDGFYVVHDATANYPQTTHSLASSLNMTHLLDLADRVGHDSTDGRPLYRSLKGFTVARTFQKLGYTYAHVGSWWAQTSSDPTADADYRFGHVGEFPNVFTSTTMLPAIAARVGIDAFDFRKQEYNRVGFQLAALHQIAQDPRPTFTFAHFTLPHPPYTHAADGSFVPSPDLRPIPEAYLAQLQATNRYILDLVSELLAGPPESDPIVVIQSDEGPYPEDVEATGAHIELPSQPEDVLRRKLTILNAYFLPGKDPKDVGLSPTVTPVNTFRIIFDAYFGGDLPLLPDRTYVYADDQHLFRFTDVTDRVRPG
jgi:Sulfatase